MSEEEKVNEEKNRDSQKSTSKNLQKMFSKFKKSKTGSRTTVKVLAKVLVSGGWILLVIILLIGIIMFFLTMPGMVMEKLKGLFTAVAKAWSAWWGDDTTGQFDNSEIYNVLNYLDDMGYDLKGYGFVTDFLNSTTQFDKDQKDASSKEKGLKVTADGVIRNEDNEIVTGVSDFIKTYLVSENYIYTIKNDNVVDTPLGALWQHFKNLFVDDMSKRNGMLAFYHDGGSIGETSENAYDSFERGYIKFEGKKLLIKKGWTNSAMSYSLDGWTGRYGMPVDFLLTVHLATQMPDLAYDMATNFKTEVKILLHESKGDVFGSYKGTNGMVDSNVVEGTINAFQGGNFITRLWNSADDLGLSEEEAQKLITLGIIPEGHNPIKDGEEGSDENCECEVDEDGNLTSVGDSCKKQWKYIIKKLKRDNDFNYSTYTPYIEKVTDHWFRDVYFIAKDNNEFVDYDYQYELITGERWSLYETDDDGEFVYYKMKEDGSTGEKYTGKVITGETILNGENGKPLKDKDGNIITERIASRGEDGTLVVKKAKTINLSDKYEDLGWNLLSNGYYSAYDTEEGTMDEYQQMYTDEEISEETEDWQKNALKNIYVHVNIGSITQTGDGLRTETNSKIKKMFLSNNYFRYDGSRQKAEIIQALREKSGVGYGAIEDDKLDDEYELKFTKVPEGKYTSEAQDGTYKLGDYVGNVSFQQDALNAFAMLENSHTADADYIYKDFKELVVELGYFKKEELTEGKAKLLQWIVPDIGSAGFPDRSIDKREEEFGTLVHSKMDIDANEKSTVYYLLQSIAENEDPDLRGGGGKPDVNPAASLNLVASMNNQVIGQNNNKGFDIRHQVGNATSQGEKDCSQVSVEEFLEKSDEIMQYMMENNFRYYSHPGGGDVGSLKSSWQEGMAAKNTCCATYVSWVLQELGVMSGHTNSCEGFFPWILEVDGVEVISSFEELQEGDILFYSDSKKGWVTEASGENGEAHVDIFYGWEDSPGGSFKIYSAGHCLGDPCTKPCSGGGISSNSSWTGGSHSTYFAIRLPFNGNKSGGAPYEGYLGNEAVVSPVTGILMEYGTYTEEEAEENRQNIDLKYNGLLEKYTFEEEIVKDPVTGEETKKIKYPSDKVGYAVIKLLDAETYKKLESTVENKWKNNSLVKVNEKAKDYEAINKHVSFKEETKELISEDRDKIWSKMDETIYGYKEFAEQYEQFGIGGYYVYIDGFKCESVDEELVMGGKKGEKGSDDTEDKKKIPQGEKLTLESFKISPEEINNKDFEPDTQSLYEPDKVSKLMSEEYTKKLEAESGIKADASLGITFSFDDIVVDEEGKATGKTEKNEYILIKEGTVLGRTLTDYELLEGEDFRNGKYGTYDEYVEAQKEFLEEKPENPDNPPENPDDDLETNKIPIIGNYLRIVMQEKDGDVVENVEDYMKLDDGETTQAGDQEYQFQEGDLEILADGIHHEGCGAYDDPSGSQEDKLYLSKSVGYTIINKLNTDSGFSPDYNDPSKLWDSSKSPLYNLLCRIPDNYDTGGYTTGTSGGWYAIALGLRKRIDANSLEYCDICLEAAEYIKENDSMNFKNNGKYDTTYNSGEGMPHTCWEQGANYYGGRVWAHFINDWLFDPKDK